jgi:hypothetical protein
MNGFAEKLDEAAGAAMANAEPNTTNCAMVPILAF